MTPVPIKRVHLGAETDLNKGRTPCEDEGRDWDALTSQGAQDCQQITRNQSIGVGQILPHGLQKETTC